MPWPIHSIWRCLCQIAHRYSDLTPLFPNVHPPPIAYRMRTRARVLCLHATLLPRPQEPYPNIPPLKSRALAYTYDSAVSTEPLGWKQLKL